MAIDEKTLQTFKTAEEMMFVSCLWKNKDLYEDYDVRTDLIQDKTWKFYYTLLGILLKNGYDKIDEYTVDTFVEGSKQSAKDIYKEAGGYDTLEKTMSVANLVNVDTYYAKIIKYESVIKLYKNGFSIDKDWDKISDFTYDELADYYEDKLANTFKGFTSEDEVKDFKDDLWGMIERADKGEAKGFPYFSRLVQNTTNGQALGNITMLAAQSGVGKTYMTLCLTMPSFIEKREPVLIMCNEEDLSKWQRELIVWVANNVISRREGFRDLELVKGRFYQGGFSDSEWKILRAANEWIQDKIEDELIRFVNFKSFSMNKTIKMIKKYARQDVKYFIIDTLKIDNDAGSNVTDIAWLHLQQNMVKLYNTIKPAALNVHCWVTYQLAKDGARYLSQKNLGMSRNAADVVSTLILLRRMFVTEKIGEKDALPIQNKDQRKYAVKEEDYRILFFDKNRMGQTDRQVVIKTDMAKNVISDVGYTNIPEDI